MTNGILWACEENSLRAYLTSVAAEVPSAFSASDYEPSALAYTEQDGVAHIPVVGILSPNGPSPIEQFFGIEGTSYNDLGSVITSADGDPRIESIVLDMNTPGGTVEGADSLRAIVDNVSKPMTAVNHGMIASAGYWLASGCDKITAKDATCLTGSIGVILSMIDVSEAYSKIGIKKITLVSKNAGSKNALTDAGQASLQAEINAVEAIFHSRVATGRGTTTDHVAQNFGSGGMLVASSPDDNDDALSVGMIDDVDNPATKTAGKTREENSMSTLRDVISENPAIEIEVEEIKKEARESGRKQVEARVAVASNYLVSDSYGASIKDLALKVVSGEVDPSALLAAAAAVDEMREEKISNKAAVESGALPETPADTPSANGQASDDGMIRNAVDLLSEAAKLKGVG